MFSLFNKTNKAPDVFIEIILKDWFLDGKTNAVTDSFDDHFFPLQNVDEELCQAFRFSSFFFLQLDAENNGSNACTNGKATEIKEMSLNELFHDVSFKQLRK